MKILLCHNYYQQPGGEDLSFAAEAELLEAHGHQVIRFTRHNDAIHSMDRFRLAGATLWNRASYRALRRLIRRERPKIMHCTNTFPLISPAAYYAAEAEKLPVVQSLRNYRLFCLNSYFLRAGQVCEICLGRRVAWPGIRYRCYRSQRRASVVVAAMLSLHRIIGTWRTMVHRYFTPTPFGRQKHLEGGLPPERVAVKPNFVHPDPGAGDGRGGYAVFVGRLSSEKGVKILLAAWRQLARHLPLKIIGDGPMAPLVKAAADTTVGIEWLGRRPNREVLALLGEAVCLVMPSVWYEAFGRTIVEAYAKGTPVVASNLGAMADLVRHGETGLLCEPGDPQDLIRVIHLLMDAPDELMQMRDAARREFEAKYTAQKNYRLLMGIYQEALETIPGKK